MYYQVSKEFFDKLPNACFGAVAVRGLDNTHDIPELEEMLRFANTAASIVTTRRGALRVMPEPEEIQALLAEKSI